MSAIRLQMLREGVLGVYVPGHLEYWEVTERWGVGGEAVRH